MSPILELKNVTKEFHGVAALRNVSFTLMPGEVHSLLGENGAGKSTLTKIMAGVHEPAQGGVVLNGPPVTIRSPAEARHQGHAMGF